MRSKQVNEQQEENKFAINPFSDKIKEVHKRLDSICQECDPKYDLLEMYYQFAEIGKNLK